MQGDMGVRVLDDCAILVEHFEPSAGLYDRLTDH